MCFRYKAKVRKREIKYEFIENYFVIFVRANFDSLLNETLCFLLIMCFMHL